MNNITLLKCPYDYSDYYSVQNENLRSRKLVFVYEVILQFPSVAISIKLYKSIQHEYVCRLIE